jgi:hypothetical protein
MMLLILLSSLAAVLTALELSYDDNPALPYRAKWIRPKNAVLYRYQLPSEKDFTQGAIGNCYFIQVLSALAISDPKYVKV